MLINCEKMYFKYMCMDGIYVCQGATGRIASGRVGVFTLWHMYVTISVYSRIGDSGDSVTKVLWKRYLSLSFSLCLSGWEYVWISLKFWVCLREPCWPPLFPFLHNQSLSSLWKLPVCFLLCIPLSLFPWLLSPYATATSSPGCL